MVLALLLDDQSVLQEYPWCEVGGLHLDYLVWSCEMHLWKIPDKEYGKVYKSNEARVIL
jgi:hypothetical protein